MRGTECNLHSRVYVRDIVARVGRVAQVADDAGQHVLVVGVHPDLLLLPLNLVEDIIR